MSHQVLVSDQILTKADFDKANGLIPAIIQHTDTGEVLMLGWMNQSSLQQTIETSKVTFFSRSRQALWIKGETSGNYLNCISVALDCDNDTLLVQARPVGPTCHTGANTCWHDDFAKPFLNQLIELIESRKQDMTLPDKQHNSYCHSLFKAGTKRVAQKVGEEGVETALAAVAGDKNELINEASDLLFHLLVLLEDNDLKLQQVQECLQDRHKSSQ